MGKLIPTSSSPNAGCLICAAILPVLADLGVMWKTTGFLDHAANLFCSYCLLHKNEIEMTDLNIIDAHLQSSQTALKQMTQWRQLPTKAAMDQFSTNTGVHSTPLTELPYFDPVHNPVLGFMHCWLLGKLQTQLRDVWRLGPKKLFVADRDDAFSDSEVTGSSSEYDDFSDEGSSTLSECSNTLSHFSQSHSLAGLQQPSSLSIPSSDAETDDDASYLPSGCSFTKEQILLICEFISQIHLPTYIKCPPRNLGEKKHGKLQAIDYITLFSFIFPIALPIIWQTFPHGSCEHRMLENFVYLVAATNIIIAYSTTDAEADCFTHYYVQYQETVHMVQSDYKSKPNDHYAMHTAAMLKQWGPLAELGEFGGEQTNRRLGDILTNNHDCKSLSIDYVLFLT
jgi:hypothetical protein